MGRGQAVVRLWSSLRLQGSVSGFPLALGGGALTV